MIRLLDSAEEVDHETYQVASPKDFRRVALALLNVRRDPGVALPGSRFNMSSCVPAKKVAMRSRLQNLFQAHR